MWCLLLVLCDSLRVSTTPDWSGPSNLSPSLLWLTSPGIHLGSILGRNSPYPAVFWCWMGVRKCGAWVPFFTGCCYVAPPVFRSQTTFPSSYQLLEISFSGLLLFLGQRVGTNRSIFSCLIQQYRFYLIVYRVLGETF